MDHLLGNPRKAIEKLGFNPRKTTFKARSARFLPPPPPLPRRAGPRPHGAAEEPLLSCSLRLPQELVYEMVTSDLAEAKARLAAQKEYAALTARL